MTGTREHNAAFGSTNATVRQTDRIERWLRIGRSWFLGLLCFLFLLRICRLQEKEWLLCTKADKSVFHFFFHP